MPPAQPCSASSATPAGAAASSRLLRLVTLIAAVWYAADQLSKAWALDALADGSVRPFIGELIRLRLVLNPGAAFSLGTGSTWLLTIVAVIVTVVVLRASRRLGSLGWAWAFGMLLGGAFGNLTDRLIRPPGFGQGHVVDFLDYHVFIGNIADIAIVAAAALIALLSLRGIHLEGTPDPDRPEATAETRERTGDDDPDGATS